MSLADELAKGGGKFLEWETPGTMYDGTIKAVTMRQAKKYKSTELAFWDDGTPKLQCVLTLATALRDPSDPEDDGTRQVSINLWSGQKAALVKACKDAGVPEPQPGQAFRATHISGVGNADSPREFVYLLGPAPAAGGGLAGAIAAPPAAPAAQAAPFPPQQQPAFPPAQPPAAAPPQQWATPDPWAAQQQPQQAPPVAPPQFAAPPPPPQQQFAPAPANAADYARQLLAQGYDVPTAAQMAGLPPNTVAVLAASMQPAQQQQPLPQQPPF